MNIVFFNSIGLEKYGGGEKWMIKAARGLSDSGHNVIFCARKDSAVLRAALAAAIRTRVFNIRSDFSPINSYRPARFRQEEKTEMPVCNLNKDGRVAGVAARLSRGPVVIARHGVLLCGRKWKHRLTLTRLTDGILTNTETIRSAYRKYGWFRDDFIEVIYNGVEVKDDVKPYDFSERFPGKKIVFSAGRLAEQKGFSCLIEAAAMLRRKRDDLVFVIAGKGRLEGRLKRLASNAGVDDCVIFEGFVENVDSYLRGCDLAVLSSLFEGMPNIVMEAMAVGKAVVATDVNGVRELMVAGETGEIVRPRDVAALAGVIDRLIDDTRLLEEYGRNGMKRVESCFTMRAMIAGLEEYFAGKLGS